MERAIFNNILNGFMLFCSGEAGWIPILCKTVIIITTTTTVIVAGKSLLKATSVTAMVRPSPYQI
jgi:hypothetical protein